MSSKDRKKRYFEKRSSEKWASNEGLPKEKRGSPRKGKRGPSRRSSEEGPPKGKRGPLRRDSQMRRRGQHRRGISGEEEVLRGRKR